MKKTLKPRRGDLAALEARWLEAGRLFAQATLPSTRHAMRTQTLPQAFYDRSASAVAPELLGCMLVHETPDGAAAGRIVEVEAYLASNDAANHAHRGMTERNAVMFGPPGHAYVYLIYGMHYCLNAVCCAEGVPEAVLIRALEPVEGIEAMRRRRRRAELKDLTSGPAKLCQALGISGEVNGAGLTAPPLGIVSGPRPTSITRTTRVGVSAAKDVLLRWCDAGSPFLSRPIRK